MSSFVGSCGAGPFKAGGKGSSRSRKDGGEVSYLDQDGLVTKEAGLMGDEGLVSPPVLPSGGSKLVELGNLKLDLGDQFNEGVVEVDGIKFSNDVSVLCEDLREQISKERNPRGPIFGRGDRGQGKSNPTKLHQNVNMLKVKGKDTSLHVSYSNFVNPNSVCKRNAEGCSGVSSDSTGSPKNFCGGEAGVQGGVVGILGCHSASELHVRSIADGEQVGSFQGLKFGRARAARTVHGLPATKENVNSDVSRNGINMQSSG